MEKRHYSGGLDCEFACKLIATYSMLPGGH